jgi:nucleotide-binding universal stress UspA family protein
VRRLEAGSGREPKSDVDGDSMNETETLRILIPLDGSAISDSILTALLPLIRTRRVEATLLQVVASPQAGEDGRRFLEGRRKALEGQGLASRIQVVLGSAAGEILRQAQTGAYDLIAMGTHGHMGLQRVLLGSVSEEVVRSSTVPILLCRANSRVGNWDRILVALDGTPGSEEILGDVVRLARGLHATVHLLRVSLSLLTADGYRGLGYQYPTADAMPYLKQIAARLSSEGIAVVPESREGMPGVEIAMLAQELDTGLICMTTEGRPERVPGLDRSVAAEVIQRAPCPVYVRPMAAHAWDKGTRSSGKREQASR